MVGGDCEVARRHGDEIARGVVVDRNTSVVRNRQRIAYMDVFVIERRRMWLKYTCGGVSTSMASTTVETVECDDIPDERLTSVLTVDSGVATVQRIFPPFVLSAGNDGGEGWT